jgi:hypothetical protein
VVNEHGLGYQNGDLLVAHNFGLESCELPAGEIILSSLSGNQNENELLPDQTVWIRLAR